VTVKAARISRIRGIWLAGFVALSLLTFGIVPHTSAAHAGLAGSVPVVQSGAHLDQVALTRAPSPHLAALKSPVAHGDLAAATALLGLVGWLLAAGPGRRSARPSLLRGQRLSRAPPLTA
jgi:hypothetical protein